MDPMGMEFEWDPTSVELMDFFGKQQQTRRKFENDLDFMCAKSVTALGGNTGLILQNARPQFP